MNRKQYRRRIVMCKDCSGYFDCIKDGFSLWPLDEVDCPEYEPDSYCNPSVVECLCGWAFRASVEQLIDSLPSHPSELELVCDIREEGVVF